jgi:hypothetical protein
LFLETTACPFDRPIPRMAESFQPYKGLNVSVLILNRSS